MPDENDESLVWDFPEEPIITRDDGEDEDAAMDDELFTKILEE